jgi:hypothetical protein
MYAAGATAIGIATVPDGPAFLDPPQPCLMTGLIDCTDRQCELHYSLAPLLLAPDADRDAPGDASKDAQR